jgi:hypothetical protein
MIKKVKDAIEKSTNAIEESFLIIGQYIIQLLYIE